MAQGNENRMLSIADLTKMLEDRNNLSIEPIVGVNFKSLIMAVYNFFYSESDVNVWLDVFSHRIQWLDQIMKWYSAHNIDSKKLSVLNEEELHPDLLKLKIKEVLTQPGPLQDVFLFMMVKVYDKYNFATAQRRTEELGKYLLLRMESLFRESEEYYLEFDDESDADDA